MLTNEVLIVGNGHYVSGQTSVSNSHSTDKDFGIILPSLIQAQQDQLIGKINILARNKDKLQITKKKAQIFSDNIKHPLNLDTFSTEDGYNVQNIIEKKKGQLAVFIAVPDKLHFSTIKTCIENNTPFFVVKPAVTNLSEYYELRDLLSNSNTISFVDYHKIFDDANLLLRDQIENGQLGTIQLFTSSQTQKRLMLDIYREWLTSENPPNVNDYLGSHYIHLFGYISKAKPVNVRSTGQTGVALDILKRPIYDMIQTSVEWILPNSKKCHSFHISGWSDPNETPSMTEQNIRLVGTNAIIESDQRNRGYKEVGVNGTQTPNPYFFQIRKEIGGQLSSRRSYGNLSILCFLKSISETSLGRISIDEYNSNYPSLFDSEDVTCILEASRISLKNNSSVVHIGRENNRYILK